MSAIAMVQGFTSRIAKAFWWLGVPAAGVAGVLLAEEYRPAVVEQAISTLWPTAPLLVELVASYPFTGVALTVMVVLAAVNHGRRTPRLRVESLLLPSYLAGLEACVRLSAFGRCGGVRGEATWAAMHAEVHVSAAASVIAVMIPAVVAAFTVRCFPVGVSGKSSLVSFLPVAAVSASVALIWVWNDLAWFG